MKLECLFFLLRIRSVVPSLTQRPTLSVNIYSVDITQRNDIHESKTIQGIKHKSLPDMKGICFVFSLLPLFLLLVRWPLVSYCIIVCCIVIIYVPCQQTLMRGGGAWQPIDGRVHLKKKDLKSFQTINSTCCIIVFVSVLGRASVLKHVLHLSLM